MRRIWLCALPLFLTACNTVNAGGVSNGPRDWYVDALKPHGQARSQAVKLADGAKCNNLAMRAAPYDQARFDTIIHKCMSNGGWRLVRFEPASSTASTPTGSTWSDSTPAPNDDSGSSAANAAIDASNQQAATDASVAAAQQANDAANAATVQTEMQFNTIYAAPN